MQIHHPAAETNARSGDHQPSWLWVVRDDQGLQVDFGRTGDQASALRHARRSALQRQGEHSIEVREMPPTQHTGVRRSPM